MLKNHFAKNLIRPQKRGTFLEKSDNIKCYLVAFEDEKGELKIR